MAGVLFGLLSSGRVSDALKFGNAMSAVKNTVPGDLPASSYEEISRIITAHESQSTQSEMDR